jgi:hypothetical protein
MGNVDSWPAMTAGGKASDMYAPADFFLLGPAGQGIVLIENVPHLYRRLL